MRPAGWRGLYPELPAAHWEQAQAYWWRFLFMAAIYGMNRGIIMRRIKNDRHKNIESYGTVFKLITMVVMPFILSTAVANMATA